MTKDVRSRSWRPGGRATAWGAVALITTALLAVVLATFLSNRYGERQRDRLGEELEPMLRQVERLEVASLLLSVEARGFALTGDPAALERYNAVSLERTDAAAVLAATARVAEMEALAAPMLAASEAHAAMPERVIAARQRSDAVAAQQAVAEGAPLLIAVEVESEALADELVREMSETRSALNRAGDIELGVTVVAAVLSALAAAMLVALLATNIRLARRVAHERGRMRDLVTSVPGIVWEAWGRPDAAEQRIDYVSEHVEDMLGYTVGEWLSTPNFWLSIVHRDDRARAGSEAAAIFEAGSGGGSQFRWVAKDGRVVDVLALSTVIRDEAGRPAGMRGVTLDISDRVRAEQAQRLSADASELLSESLDAETTLERLAALVVPGLADWCTVHLVEEDGAARQVVVAHSDADKVRWAKELQQRYPPDVTARQGVFEVIRSGRPELVPEIPDELLRSASRDEEELRLIREVGLKSYVCAPLSVRGRVLGALTLISAESGRRYGEYELTIAQELAARAAVALENAQLYAQVESERARYASIVASVQHGVIQLDARRRVLDMNPAAEQLLGYRRDEIAGRSVHQALHPDCGAPGAGTCAWNRALIGRHTVNLQTTLSRSQGGTLEAEVDASPIEIGGRIVGTVLTVKDISGRLEQERMKDDFIGFASHELRSPLTTLNGMAKWLERYAREHPAEINDDLREAIETLSQGAERMGGIVELFLDLTRIESGRLTLDLDDVDFCRLVREEAEHLSLRAREASVRSEIEERTIVGVSDENRVRQVVINLLDNAVKYGGAPPEVAITLTREGDAACIRVRDNGDGIAPEDRPHIFERFYRGAGAQRKKGLGIGLFVSREIVSRLGGSLTYEADGGKAFVVRLPLAAAAMDSEGEAITEAGARR